MQKNFLAFFMFLRRRAEQKMEPHFFSGGNIQQCTMHKYTRVYSQNQIMGLKQMRTIKLHFGKTEKFSVIQKEKYFNVCICYEKKNLWASL